MKKLFLIVSAALLATTVYAQATKEEIMSDIHNMGYVYSPYPDVDHQVSAYPKGYEPFHIEHLGRHGSRNLENMEDYTDLYECLHKGDSLGLLTPLGKQLKTEVEVLLAFVEDRCGMLVPRGEREHRHIIDRMYRNYPEVFSTKGGRECWVDASSTKVFRTMMSLAYGLDELKTLNPEIRTTRTSDDRIEKALYALPQYRAVYKETSGIRFDYSNVDPTRLMKTIYTDYSFLSRKKQTLFLKCMWRFACVGAMNQGDLDQDYYKYLTVEDIFPMWEKHNLFMYLSHGPSTKYGKRVASDLVPLLRSMIENEQACFEGRGPAAGLHYAHDIHVMPMASLMGIKGCATPETDINKVYEVWCDYIVSPMACNIQLVFFKKKNAKDDGDVLVKVLMNEKESSFDGLETTCWPYYRWTDVKAFFERRMNGEY
ncbi:MAG: histidine phosphatase family protein [Bacteroidales bacterium]|nr:histidine phosphatase family protein [Bacteroidales bacterium]